MIKQKLNKIKDDLLADTVLVAVSKTKPNSLIEEAYDAGQRIFGENKALELRDKFDSLPKDIEWHFIGRLQTNKVKYVVRSASLIHSVDRIKLAEEINKEAIKESKVQDILVQLNVSNEDSKAGFEVEDLENVLNKLSVLSNIRVVGLMTMAPFVDDPEEIRYVFKRMKELFDSQKDKYKLKYLSMGMSNDYQVALQEGANMIRVGSKIFGSRDYKSSSLEGKGSHG